MAFPQFFSRQPEEFGGKIPFIITDSIEQLKKLNAETIKGIFRLSGSARDVSLLCSTLDSGRVVDWSIFDYHAITGSLKKYFREKINDSPFFPFTVYEEITSIAKITQEERQIEIIKKVFATFSKPRFLSAVYLFRYLLEVTKSVELNSMGPDNIAIVFAPNLLNLRDQTPEQKMTANPIQNKAISTIIKLIDIVFGDVEISDKYTLTDNELVIIGPPPLNQNDLNQIRAVRALRKRSIMPCIPYQYVGKFRRPTREYIPPGGTPLKPNFATNPPPAKILDKASQPRKSKRPPRLTNYSESSNAWPKQSDPCTLR